MTQNSLFQFSLNGFEELENAFAQLPKAVERQVLREALIKSAVPIAIAAVRFAPKGKGSGPHLKDSIGVSTKLSRRQRRRYGKSRYEAEVFVGSRDPKAHLIEFGTGPRYTKKGAYRGQSAAQPFMRPAWNLKKKAAMNNLERIIWRELAKKARRLRRSSERLQRRLR